MKEKLKQCRKPHGDYGKEVINDMNNHHEVISNYAMESIELMEDAKIIDIGCGGGVNIEKFLKRCPGGVVDGLDYSSLSVAESIKRNKKAVDDGRCHIYEANVLDIPLDDGSYDLASAFETIYFWKDLNKAFSEVYRILDDEGRFMIACDTDSDNPDNQRWVNLLDDVEVYSKDELVMILKEVGFGKIDVFHRKEDYLLVIVAGK
ncbi:MAG: class I SAM-dependent methyltransferase [Methanosphaera sp.]|nr:class I SAM-dependent methyltransferase [Methanosphaera sp.]